MREGFINVSRLASLAGVAILVMVANVLASILYMVVYSYVIDPGHQNEYYDAHVQVAAPYCSIVAGMPLMFFAGLWISGWWGGKFRVQSAVVVWLVYAVVDLGVLLAAGLTSKMAMVVVVSLVTKLAAIYVGAVIAGRRPAS